MNATVLDEATIRTEVRAFLQDHHVMSLATVVDGVAHASSVMYAAADFSLFWTSEQRTRHSTAIEHEARVSATIAPDYSDFRAIRGVQLAGRARRLTDPGEAEVGRRIMARRYRFLQEMELLPETLRRVLNSAAYYRLDPEQLTWIDNTRGFGSRSVLRLR